MGCISVVECCEVLLNAVGCCGMLLNFVSVVKCFESSGMLWNVVDCEKVL